MSILYIRDDKTGEFTEVPMLRGPRGFQGPKGDRGGDGIVLKNYLHNSNFTHFIAQRGINANHLNKKSFLGDRWRSYAGSNYVYTAEHHEIGGYKNVYVKGVISQIVENAPATGYAYVSTLSGTATPTYVYDASTGVGTFTITSTDGCILDQAWLYDEESNVKPAKRGYSEELMECFRYFFFLPESNALCFSGFAFNATTVRFTIPLPVPMRLTNPSYRITSLNNFSVMPGNVKVSAVSSVTVIGNTVCFELTTSSNVTAGDVVVLKTNTNIELCADLEPEMYE
jgi:hypothetical protein